ncbi:MAG TPA: methylmalonyl Co-A mutase-associated GTPase MeaB [Candidatus Limnocylindrales bacterium]|nr:methylmalonyl Co-A mutase-associated GTPase MeaB [Candidatus Limnocylindrales bacterium]
MTRSLPLDLVPAALQGDRRALARLLTAVENRAPGADAALAALFPRTGRAWRIGITGAPGTGKSTLVTALARHYRAQGRTVGVLAIDPTSPFTGGAILGDRIRMRDLAGDSGVFIRSMAARGSLGGLAAATGDLARVLDAAGFDVVLVETVGAGQNEVAVAAMAQTTIVVDAPGLGDDVQAIKAGILEIADVLAVNKADQPGAKNTVRALRAMIETGHPAARTTRVTHHGQRMAVSDATEVDMAPLWIPPIIETVALEGRGVAELAGAIARHRAHLTEAGDGVAVERQQITLELFDRLREALMARLLERLPAGAVEQAASAVQARALDPSAAVESLMDAALADGPSAAVWTNSGY